MRRGGGGGIKYHPMQVRDSGKSVRKIVNGLIIVTWWVIYKQVGGVMMIVGG